MYNVYETSTSLQQVSNHLLRYELKYMHVNFCYSLLRTLTNDVIALLKVNEHHTCSFRMRQPYFYLPIYIMTIIMNTAENNINY